MGSREDGGPATLNELLEHYRKMAEVHHDRWKDKNQTIDRRHGALAMSAAYGSAADELEKVLALRVGGTV